MLFLSFNGERLQLILGEIFLTSQIHEYCAAVYTEKHMLSLAPPAYGGSRCLQEVTDTFICSTNKPVKH